MLKSQTNKEKLFLLKDHLAYIENELDVAVASISDPRLVRAHQLVISALVDLIKLFEARINIEMEVEDDRGNID